MSICDWDNNFGRLIFFLHPSLRFPTPLERNCSCSGWVTFDKYQTGWNNWPTVNKIFPRLFLFHQIHAEIAISAIMRHGEFPYLPGSGQRQPRFQVADDVQTVD